MVANKVLVEFDGKNDGLKKSAKESKEDIDKVKKSSQETDEQLKKTGNSGSMAGDKIGKGFKVAGVAAAAAAVAATAAIGKITGDAIKAYADFEQLSGGVDKLFGVASDAVMGNAKAAYASAGLSANAYMESVTGFSASLISGLGGDTQTAAALADKAIRDMSDNANTYGTDMESIQRTYQGFAKGQFGMLDNLKLGYGGSASEMARLINDSKVLGDATVTAANVSEVSMDKIIEAVHATQVGMGIAGTTAKEAASTISGSLASTKAAWTNVLASFASGDDNAINEALTGLLESAGNFVTNISAILPDVLAGVVQLITTLIPKIPPLLAELLPAFITGVVSVIAGLVDAIPGLLDTLTEIIPELVDGFVEIFLSLVDALPEILEGVLQLFTAIAEALLEPATLKKIIEALGEAIVGLVDSIVEFIKDPKALNAILEGAITLFIEIVKALPEIIVALVRALPILIKSLVAFLTDPKNLGLILGAFLTLGLELLKAIPLIIKEILKAFGDLIPGMDDFIGGLVDGIVAWFKELPAAFILVMLAIKNAAIAAWDWVWVNVIKRVIDLVVAYFNLVVLVWSTILNTIKTVATTVWDFIWGAISKVIDWIVAYFNLVVTTWTLILTTIKDKAVEIWDKITSTITGAIDKVKAVWNGIVTWFTDKFDKIVLGAKTIKDGIVNAITGAFDSAKKIVKDAINWIIKKINTIIKGFNKVAGKIPGIDLKIPEIPELANGGYINYASGGRVTGKGSGTSDSIPAMLSNGEFVLRASAVKNLGVDNVTLMNEGKTPQGDSPVVGQIVMNENADPLALAQQIGAMVRFA